MRSARAGTPTTSCPSAPAAPRSPPTAARCARRATSRRAAGCRDDRAARLAVGVPRAPRGRAGGGLPARRDAGRRQDARGVRGGARRRMRAARRRLPDVGAALAVGGRGRPRRPAPRSALAQRRRRLAGGRRRRRGDLPAGRLGAGPVRPPPRTPDVRRARRDPSRGRVCDVGHGAARGVRRRGAATFAVGHAVSLRRPRDPVRPLRRRAALRAGLRLRLCGGCAGRGLPAGRVSTARRDVALARRRPGDDRRVRRSTPRRRCCRSCCATRTGCC